MFEENIRNFNKQLEWEPEVQNQGLTFLGIQGQTFQAIVLGMGGSHLGADLLKAYDSKINLVVHSDYGLPPEILQGSTLQVDNLVVASSYSGNTEEVIDGLNLVLEKSLKTAVIASGGRLIEIAKEKDLPYIQLPAGLQPRMSAGYQLKALAKLLGREDMLKELGSLTQKLNPSKFEAKGKELAEKLPGKIPLIYSSERNKALAYTWKIRFNETAKVPAFYNLFPELNHNEMNGFGEFSSSMQGPSMQGPTLHVDNFSFLLLNDSQDHPKIQKRMEVFAKLFTDKGLPVEQIALAGEGRFYQLFANLILADWTSFHLAKQKGVDPEAILLVEEFKELIK